jgi:hypothetical protein
MRKAEEEEKSKSNRWRDVLKESIQYVFTFIAVLVRVGPDAIKLRRRNESEEDYYRKQREERNKSDVEREQEMAE